jgi:hypothetical protein
MVNLPYEEEVLEQGSELGIARRFWRVLGFHPDGYAHAVAPVGCEGGKGEKKRAINHGTRRKREE